MKFAKSQRQELNRQHTLDELAAGLARHEPVVYRENGNRQVNGRKFLKTIESIAPKVGVTRVADISYLGSAPYPVIQSCRPNYYSHAAFGQNSGAQGKGQTQTQAILSCLMETIEGYCCEPRNPELIRASFDFLRAHQLVYDPRNFARVHGVKVATPEEPLMWTKARCLMTEVDVLVPAELIYFPFLTEDFETRAVFPTGTNGLASGSSYLEATIHALYEVIERHYVHHFELGTVQAEALFDDELTDPKIRKFIKELANESQAQFYAIELPEKKNVPTILCALVGDAGTHLGWGASATVDISVGRAFSEALQSLAANISGTREDLSPASENANPVGTFVKTPQPQKQTLHLREYKKRVHDKTFASLNDELGFILKWLRQRGHRHVFGANLTRVGIDVPVVKVVVPGLELPYDFKTRASVTSQRMIKHSYPNILGGGSRA